MSTGHTKSSRDASDIPLSTRRYLAQHVVLKARAVVSCGYFVWFAVFGGGDGDGQWWWWWWWFVVVSRSNVQDDEGQCVPTHSVRNASDGWQLMQNRHVATAITVRHSAADTEAEEEAAATRLSAPVPSSSLASLPPLE